MSFPPAKKAKGRKKALNGPHNDLPSKEKRRYNRIAYSAVLKIHFTNVVFATIFIVAGVEAAFLQQYAQPSLMNPSKTAKPFFSSQESHAFQKGTRINRNSIWRRRACIAEILEEDGVPPSVVNKVMGLNAACKKDGSCCTDPDEHQQAHGWIANYTSLPRHPTNEDVNYVLTRVESFLKELHYDRIQKASQTEGIITEEHLSPETLEEEEQAEATMKDSTVPTPTTDVPGMKVNDETHQDVVYRHSQAVDSFLPIPPRYDKVFSNSYVDLSRIETIGFDFDYTLVTYSIGLLSLIYDMALDRLVDDKQYPVEMKEALRGKFDAFFSIRGLAVDRETGWICHLSYTHKVAAAWEGREKVTSDRLYKEYRYKRSMRPPERKTRLKPLNDLFSMAECCLIADAIQFFKDRGIPFFPRSCVEDILDVIGRTHMSGDFHRLVAANPEKYFEPKPHLADVLHNLKESGKKLIFVSNSPFWYVDAGMNYVMGPDWRKTWDAVIVSAGKPRFYTDDARPFREVSTKTGRIKFKKIDRIEPGEVYTEGCLKELTRCLRWSTRKELPPHNDLESQTNAGYSLASPNVLYIGDSLFADLVDAKREFGWTTAAVTPEVGHELELQSGIDYASSQRTIEVLLFTLRKVQDAMGVGQRTKEDIEVMDELEGLMSTWRDEQIRLMGNPFGSVFRARFQPSLFAHSLRRYCDLYMPSVESLRMYSPNHRFYPEEARLLGHEVMRSVEECWDFEELFT